MLSHGIPPIIVAGMRGHCLAILKTAWCWVSQWTLNRNLQKKGAWCWVSQWTLNRNLQKKGAEAGQPARKISSLGFAAKYAAQLMDDILTTIPIDLRDLKNGMR